MTKSRRFRRCAGHAIWMAAAAALGLAFSLSTRSASADLIPLPTVTIPGVTTVTVPAVTLPLPTTTTTATTTTPATTTAASTTATAGGQGQSTAPGAQPSPTRSGADSPAAAGTVAGELRLANGVASIPVSSVQAPTHLVIRGSVAPSVIRRGNQRLTVKLTIADTRAFVVRGARVTIRTSPAGMLVRRLAPKRSAVDGRLTFVGRAGSTRSRFLTLLVTAGDPDKPGAVATSRRFRIPVRPVR